MSIYDEMYIIKIQPLGKPSGDIENDITDKSVTFGDLFNLSPNFMSLCAIICK